MNPPTLIGPAGSLIDGILNRADPAKPFKLLLYGPPGVGKTTLAEQIASRLGESSRWDTESINGRNVTIDVVREWQLSLHCSSMFGDWKVKIINEADVMPKAAQDVMLSLLDYLPDKRAVICTSNLDLNEMTPRFRTRFVSRKVDAPPTKDIALLLVSKGLPLDQASFIAETAAGNVRAALLDAEAWLDDHRPAKGKTNVRQTSLDAAFFGL